MIDKWVIVLGNPYPLYVTVEKDTVIVANDGDGHEYLINKSLVLGYCQ